MKIADYISGFVFCDISEDLSKGMLERTYPEDANEAGKREDYRRF